MENKDFMNQKMCYMTPIELAKAIILKEKETNSVPQPEFKVGDRVRIVQYWKGYNSSLDGTEREFVEVIPYGGTYAGEYRLRKLDGGQYFIAYKIEKVKAKPKEEWKDITKECDFKFQHNTLGKGFGFLDIYHNKKGIGTCMSHIPIRIDMDNNYKLEKIDIEGNLQFKILKRCE